MIKIFYHINENNVNINNNIKPDESSRLLTDVLNRCGVLKERAVVRPKRGKPYIAGAPDVQFSVTHTKNIWICAVFEPDSSASGLAAPCVGIDAEFANRRVVRPEKLAEKYFSEAEKLCFYKNINNCSDKIKNECFVKSWTMKEAYLKMLGTGITDSARNNCSILDKNACFISGKQKAQTENELSVALGSSICVSLCIGAGKISQEYLKAAVQKIFIYKI